MGDSYAASLRQKPPTESANLLRTHWSAGKSASDRIAQWIHGYSQLQRRHAAELESFLGKHVLSEEVLETLSEPWQRLAAMILEQARLTNEAARRAEIEGSQGLRRLPSQTDIDSILLRVSQGNLEATEAFQKNDIARLNTVKSCLTSFASIEADRAQAFAKATEDPVRAWINYDPNDGVQAFVAQIISGVASTNTESSDRARGVSTSTHGTQSSVFSGASRQSSQATVQRKSSFVGKDKDEPKSPGSSLRSRMGSIFGRRKNKQKNTGTPLTPLGSDNGSAPRTAPPDFGPRHHSFASTHSNMSSPVPSLRQSRQRDSEEPPSPTRNGLSSQPLTPTKVSKPRASSPLRSSSPLRQQVQPEAPKQPAQQPSQQHVSQSVPQSSQQSAPQPTYPVVPQAVPQPNALPQQEPSSPFQAPVPQVFQPAPLSQRGTPEAPQQVPRQVSPQQVAPQQIPQQIPQQQAPVQPVPQALQPQPTQHTGDAPIPPPARHSLHRVSSLSRTPSSASQARNPSNYRDSRVGSQIFSSLPVAHHDPNRDSFGGMLPAQNTGAPISPVSPVSPISPVNPHQGIPSEQSAQSSPLARETDDSLGPLPVPNTPHNVNLGQPGPAATPGSPEQFWTPAQKFTPQFPSFEHANSSIASLGSRVSGPVFPELPSTTGLVAAAVEHIEAEYESDQVVSSSIHGEAVARINGPPLADSVVLGILLADPNARLTPSNLLKQTSHISFDVPYSTYSSNPNGQDLVQYTADSATGRIPIKLTPIWRFEASTVRLVLSYQLSELYVGGGDEVEIKDLVITVSIAGAARAHAAQSKPVATFSREKQRVTWRFTQPQILRRGQPATKLLCQFVTDGNKASPGRIELKTRVSNVQNSVLQLRTLSPQGEWVAVPTVVGGEIVTKVGGN